MAHFAEIDNNNVVLRVVVVDNKDTSDDQGVEKEHVGASYLERLLGGAWKQTSYNGKIRKNYAGIGYVYDAALDAFVPPKPYPSWLLNADTAQWKPPVPVPTDGKMYAWSEKDQVWTEIPAGNPALPTE
jgi:hypothetical protein